MPISHDAFLALASARCAARARKDFKEADRLREKIEAGGYWIQDADNGGYSFGPKVETVTQGVEVTALKPVKKPSAKPSPNNK